MRGWTGLYGLSWQLGVRQLLRRGYSREALIRLLVPLDPSRYLEIPDALAQVDPAPGERVLDLASPKLAAVALARRGARVTSVDALESEIATWRTLTAGEPGVEFEIGDGRALDHADGSFDHAYSISVIEHIADDGDVLALGELARVVRPGGRVVVTLPYTERYQERWRDRPVYGEGEGRDGRYFFERWYDAARVRQLTDAVPSLELTAERVVSMAPNWHRLYTRAFPWLLPLGPFFGLLATERVGPPGDVVRLTFRRRQAP